MNAPSTPATPDASPETLDPLRFPLYGSRLIEASAGTGKTYTIAALYVRLVLGHGQEQGYARALTPPEILVVTFTDAATQELRDRIRSRLAEAAAYFFADPQNLAIGPDDFLPDHPTVAWRREHLPGVRLSYRCNSMLSVTELVRAGLGVAALPDFLLGDGLHPLGPALAGHDTALWLLTRPDCRALRSVVTLFDELGRQVQLPRR